MYKIVSAVLVSLLIGAGLSGLMYVNRDKATICTGEAETIVRLSDGKKALLNKNLVSSYFDKVSREFLSFSIDENSNQCKVTIFRFKSGELLEIELDLRDLKSTYKGFIESIEKERV